ncbi:MAG: ATP-dependent Clp protease proteolytic subunit [Bacteroidales bacterium]|jgi:ATP-dependent Clp protease protease subunit|nr:ATP-dependent Clp protease proteolytic subunit [Bacteroidales bacterium]
MISDFEKFATGKMGISSLALNDYARFTDYINPSIIEERKLNVAVMDVFSRLMMERIIFLGVPITDDVANIIQAQLLYLDSGDSSSDIQLYVNSPGGVVYAGLGIYDTMQTIGSDVSTTCTGLAASMASILLAAGTHGKRRALQHSRVMIHQPLGGAEGQASDIEITAREIVKIKEELYQILVDHTGRTMVQITKDADRDHWMTSSEALEYGIIDEVVKPGNVKKGKKKNGK